MKKAILLLFVALLIGAATGCANGPIRSLFKRSCNQCQSPALQPSFGMGFDDSSSYAGGEYVNSQYGSSPSYLDDNYNDPYSSGSNYGGAAISAPVFDSYNSPAYGGTTVPPTSSGSLPSPGGGL